jgi:Cys-rich protein (TIGR01571 family)
MEGTASAEYLLFPISRKWSIGLFSCGDWTKCMYAYSTCNLALAEARSELDQSDTAFTLLNMTPCLVRWLIRSAYQIPGSACEDVITVTCCFPCAINQMFQTASDIGAPTKGFGKSHNVNFTISNHPFSIFDNLYSFFCGRCMTADNMQKMINMPWIFGFFCVGAHAAHQLTRYQYRIKGSDIYDDFWKPTCNSCLCLFCPILVFCLDFSAPYKTKNEIQAKIPGPMTIGPYWMSSNKIVSRRYLSE